MLAVVRKTMQSNTGLLQAGDIVDVSTWRNTKTLVASRYIELVENAPKSKTEKKTETAEVETAKEVKTEKTKSKK